MILETTTGMVVSGGVPTPGWSEAADFVAARAEEGRRRLQNSTALGLRAVFNELFEVAEECDSPDWDGYHAEPVSTEAYRTAYRFVEALPIGTPAPSVGADPDGDLTFEWHRGLERTLSVSVSPDGELHFAARVGKSKEYGTQPFFGEIPRRIFELIQRVSA